MALHINIFIAAAAAAATAAVAAEFTATAAFSQRTVEAAVGRGGEPETRTKRKDGGWCGEL